MIKLTEIKKVYRTKKMETLALSNVNLEVAEGEFISVMGPSGSGKSTLLNIIGCWMRPLAGGFEIAHRQFFPGAFRWPAAAGGNCRIFDVYRTVVELLRRCRAGS